MKIPRYLRPGDKVAIVSPAGRVSREQVERGAALLAQHGYEVVIGRHAWDAEGVFAGTDEARAADLQAALDDDAVRAIFCSRGGYGCLRTHELLDWSRFLTHPKWLIGFSDVTVFHAFLSTHGIPSVHGVMTSYFEREGEATESFLMTLDMLRGKMPEYHVAPHLLNRAGRTTGILTGGNLSILQSLRGTPLDVIPEGRILFIEDINEYHYHLDRMMGNLKAGGVLERLSGLVVGHFTKMKEGSVPFGKTSYEIIHDAVAAYDYPLVFGFPAGHELPMQPLRMAGRVVLEVSSEHARICFENG